MRPARNFSSILTLAWTFLWFAPFAPLASCQEIRGDEGAAAAPRGATSTPAVAAPGAKLPHVQVDVQRKQIRVECEMLGVDAPLEFFVVLNGTNEHESVLRSEAKPSHIHLALIMLGLEPGEPVKFSEQTKRWMPPHGPPLNLSVEFEKDGKLVTWPATKLMRDIKSKQTMPQHPWVFVGSRVMDDGTYAADVTGYTVSVVNFELSLIDIPQLASNANETLEWQIDKDIAPPAGTKVTMIIEPTGGGQAPAPSTPATSQPGAGAMIDVSTIKLSSSGRIELDDVPMSRADVVERLKKMQQDRPVRVRLAPAKPGDELASAMSEELRAAGVDVEMVSAKGTVASQQPSSADDVAQLRKRWEQAVAPHRSELAAAAEAHYAVIRDLRRRQQELIDQADRIGRTIEELEKQYQDLTAPRPGAGAER